MGKVIDIKHLLGDYTADEAAKIFMEAAQDVLDSLTTLPEDAPEKIKQYILLEARIMLGLSPLDEDDVSNIEPVFFDEIWDVWEEANEHCYFCSDTVDVTDEKFGAKRFACYECSQKLVSFLMAAGATKKEAVKMVELGRRRK